MPSVIALSGLFHGGIKVIHPGDHALPASMVSEQISSSLPLERPSIRQQNPILVADDEASDLYSIERALSIINPSLEYELFSSSQAVQTYIAEHEKPNSRLPQLMLLDIQMPGVNGFHLAQDIIKTYSAHAYTALFMTSYQSYYRLELDLEWTIAHPLICMPKPSQLAQWVPFLYEVFSTFHNLNRTAF